MTRNSTKGGRIQYQSCTTEKRTSYLRPNCWTVCKLNRVRKKNEGERFLKSNLWISCQYVLPQKGFDLNNKPKSRIRFVWSSSPGEFHPQALADPDVNVSAHPALIIQSLFFATSLYLLAPPFLVDQTVRPDDPTPSLHLYHRDFNITTSWSAPVSRLGTLTLVGPPLGLLP